MIVSKIKNQKFYGSKNVIEQNGIRRKEANPRTIMTTSADLYTRAPATFEFENSYSKMFTINRQIYQLFASIKGI